MITRDQLIAVGHTGKTHGVRGELQAVLDIDLDVLERLRCVVMDVDGIYVPFFLAGTRPKGAHAALLTIDGVNTEQEAAALVNKDLMALKTDYEALSDEADADEYPLDFFIGFKLDDADGSHIGEIEDVDDSTANVLFIVRRPAGEVVQVPAADELVRDIDVDERRMVMDLPAGLLDL